MQNLQAADLEQGIGLVSQYDAPLYLSLDVQGYPEQTPPLRDKPISIKRQWFTLAGQEVQPDAVKLGDLLLVRLSIESTESINDALVIDLLPSGLEIENTHLLENESLQQLTLPDMSRTVADALVSLEKTMRHSWMTVTPPRC
ncbi:MAG: hypothetical protein R3E95_12560 [Thiolinea sp.]